MQPSQRRPCYYRKGHLPPDTLSFPPTSRAWGNEDLPITPGQSCEGLGGRGLPADGFSLVPFFKKAALDLLPAGARSLRLLGLTQREISSQNNEGGEHSARPARMENWKDITTFLPPCLNYFMLSVSFSIIRVIFAVRK